MRGDERPEALEAKLDSGECWIAATSLATAAIIVGKSARPLEDRRLVDLWPRKQDGSLLQSRLSADWS